MTKKKAYTKSSKIYKASIEITVNDRTLPKLMDVIYLADKVDKIVIDMITVDETTVIVPEK